MKPRIIVLGVLASLVGAAACSESLAPTDLAPPSLDVVCETVWVDPDSTDPPPSNLDGDDHSDDDCHVVLPWY
jgi:hypothetical protein